VIQLLRFQSVSRHVGRLQALVQCPRVSPFEVFVALQEAVSDLESLRPGSQRDNSRAQEYNHAALLPIFTHLVDRRLDLALRESEEIPFIAIEFVSQQGRLTARLDRQEFLGANITAYYLGVAINESGPSVQKAIEDPRRFELTRPRDVGRGDGGLPLKFEDRPVGPPETDGSVYYFRIQHSENPLLWKRIREDREMAIGWQNQTIKLSEATFTIYAILPPRNTESESE